MIVPLEAPCAEEFCGHMLGRHLAAGIAHETGICYDCGPSSAQHEFKRLHLAGGASPDQERELYERAMRGEA